MVESLKKLVTYTLKNNFFITLLKNDDTKEIIIDSNSKTGSEISVHRPIYIRDDLSVQGNIFLGRTKNQLLDSNKKILRENISVENIPNGEILGVYYDKIMNITPKNFIYLTPLFPSLQIYNKTQFLVEEFENKYYSKMWTFVLPSYIKSNSIKIQFYFLNPSDNFSNVSFNYNIFLENESDNLKENSLNFKTKKGINTSEIITTNIIADNNNYKVNNNLIFLRLTRNKKIGSIDNFEGSIYLIGIKIEFDENYFLN